MKILDCTLRDGGFINDFNWDINFAKKYYQLMCSLNIHYVELGYWKQTSKSKNRFYKLNEKDVDLITNKIDKQNVCVIVDYHYCSKKLTDYPKKGKSLVVMIRLTARKEDVEKALTFAKKLQDYTSLDISFQIINCTNYSKKEIDELVEKIVKINFFYVYFADSHGNLNLINDFYKFEKSIQIINQSGKQIGFHLHNHTDRALLNYYFCKNNSINIIDTSVFGVGKGGGNLALENIIGNEYLVDLLIFMQKEKKHLLLNKINYLFYKLTGRMNITDNYATFALSKGMPLKKFSDFCLSLRGKKKDVFDNSLIENY
jgi:4-hydroxy 2-oxovalerate aldolase